MIAHFAKALLMGATVTAISAALYPLLDLEPNWGAVGGLSVWMYFLGLEDE